MDSYIVYGYGIQGAYTQKSLGVHRERETAEAQCRFAVTEGNYDNAQVMRRNSNKIVFTFDQVDMQEIGVS